jgi:hypothetical protein
MQDLTPRQTEILKTIIAQYTEDGEAVGSEILDKKFNLGVSPATIRNEMVELARKVTLSLVLNFSILYATLMLACSLWGLSMLEFFTIAFSFVSTTSVDF